MKKHLIIKGILGLIIIALVIISGCSVLKDNEKGDLVLNITPKDIATKTIVPDLDMNVANYDIEGNGPGGASFKIENAQPGVAVVQSGLRAGTWEIIARAKNADAPTPTVIGEGSTIVEILPGKINEATITVYPVVGTGTLDITITWPNYPDTPSIMSNPNIVSTLTPIGGTPQTIPFTIASDNLSAHFSDDTLSNGYYKLSILLYEGDPSNSQNKVWGTVEAVRIIAGQVSSKTYTLKGELGLGLVEISIEEKLDNPLNISFSGDQRFLLEGNNMEITATVTDENGNPVTPDSYEWYFDGELISGETSNTIIIGGNLLPDTYYLDLVVTMGNVISSETVVFEVVKEGQKLLISSNRDGDYEIYAINADGSNYPIQLTDNTYDDIQPAWSPDLSKIAFVSVINQKYDLYIMDADGSNITNITKTENVTEKCPAWSPDGTKLAYASNEDGNFEIYIKNFESDSITQVTSTTDLSNLNPAWASNGNQIAFESRNWSGTNQNEIIQINIDGTNPRSLTKESNFLTHDYEPCYSPNGDYIVFSTNRNSNKDIWYLDLSNPTSQTRVTTNDSDDYSPVWSTTDKIIFVSERDGDPEIFVFNRNDSSLIQITNNSASDIDPEW